MKVGIRTKLLSGLFAATILLGTIGFLGWKEMRGLVLRIHHIYDTDMSADTHLANMQRGHWELRFANLLYIVSHHTKRPQIRGEVKIFSDHVETNFQDLLNLGITHRDRNSLIEWHALFNEFRKRSDRYFDLIDAGKIEVAKEFRLKEVQPLAFRVANILTRVILNQKEHNETTVHEILDSVESVGTTSFIGLFVVVILAVLFNLLMGDKLGSSIVSLRNVAVEVAHGNLNAKMPAESSSFFDAEMAELKTAFQMMVRNLETSASEAARSLQAEKLLTEELQAKNSQLEVQALALEQAQFDLDARNKVLRQQAEKLSITAKYKTEFLANMSHELRTPLNSIIILSKLLATEGNENLTPDQIKQAKTVAQAGDDMLAMVNEILDFSKIESGKMAVNWGNFDLRELASNARAIFDPIANKKGLGFEVSFEADLPGLICSDQVHVQRILQNFLSNAFKFTDKGGVSVKIGKYKNGDKPSGTIAISVSDTGIGIPKDKQSMIFESFVQADGGISRKYGGTGLGLAISRHLAQLLGGEIQVESDAGKGSTFSVILPPVSSEADVSVS